MKTLLLAATLIAATGAVAAPAPTTETTVALSAYEAQTQLAQTQFAADDLAGAQKSLETALALAQGDEEKAETLLQLATLFDNQQRYEQARATYQRVLPLVAASPDDLATTRLFIATTYVNQKMWQSAADSWAQLAHSAASPQLKATYQLALAQSFIELKQTGKAATQLQQLRAQMAPVIADKAASADERGFALILFGRSYQTQNDFEAARQNFEAAAQLDGASSDLRVNALKSLAEVADKQGRAADTQSNLAEARQLLMNAASQRYAVREWDEALALYREAAQTGVPDAVDELSLRWQIANALREGGNVDGARLEFQRLIALAPDASNPMFVSLAKIFVPFSYYYLAQGYIAQGKFDLARAALSDELALPDLQAPVRQQAQDLLASLATAG